MKLVKHKALRRIVRFSNLSRKERAVVIWIVFQVFLVKLKVRFVPLRKYYNDYFTEGNPEFMQPNLSDMGFIHRILDILPVRISCLEEAMIVKSYLKKLGADMFISLGVRTDKDFKAHAWFLPKNHQGYQKIN